MKRTLLLLLFLTILTSPALAINYTDPIVPWPDTPITNWSMPSPLDAIAVTIADGMDTFIIRVADDLYSAGNSITGDGVSTVSNVSAVNAVFSIATFTYDPWSIQGVNDMNQTCAIIFLIGLVLFILFGATVVILQRFMPQQYEIAAHVLNEKSGSFAYKNYLMSCFTAVLIILFGYFGIRFALELNYVLTSLIMVDVLDSIAPTSDNVIMYLMMGIFYFILCIFFVWRSLVIGLMASFALLVGLLYVYGVTRSIAVLMIKYFLAMTFMQMIIVAITTMGVMIIQGLVSLGLVIPIIGEMVYYLALLILLFVVALLIVSAPLLRFIIRRAI